MGGGCNDGVIHTGIFAVVYWNGNRFGDAVQNFYHKNPQLCGHFTGECIDLDTCTLTTPSGYRTHWTKPEEARKVFQKEIGAEVVRLEEKGNGVLVAGKMPYFFLKKKKGGGVFFFGKKKKKKKKKS